MTRTPLVVAIGLLAFAAGMAAALAIVAGADRLAALCLGGAIGLGVTAWAVAK